MEEERIKKRKEKKVKVNKRVKNETQDYRIDWKRMKWNEIKRIK